MLLFKQRFQTLSTPLVTSLLGVAIILLFINFANTKDLPIVKAEKVGVSSQRLARLDTLADNYVANKQYSGVVMMVARDGKIIYQYATGSYGVDNPKPLAMDTLFRIYSMTKPITAAAAMLLYEEGKFHIDDPVSQYLPEFKQQKIRVNGELVTPDSPMTIRQLLTHTAGLSYGWSTDSPVDQQYRQAKLFDSQDLTEFVTKLADIPLKFQPNTRYYYSVATDVVGALIERLSGQTLEQFLEARIFTPLAMHDTFFTVPAEQAERLASDQSWDAKNQQIVTVPAKLSRRFDQVSLLSGGGGLVSTIGDYLRFSQMILNAGELHGVRILGAKTIEFMTLNHLSPQVRATGVGEFPEIDLYSGQSMALGYGLVTDPAAMPDIASKGELSWGGIAGTKFWIDPKEKLIGIAMVQLYQAPWRLRFDMKNITYAALQTLY